MKKDWQYVKEENVYKDSVLSIRHVEYKYNKINKNMVFTLQDMNSWAIVVPVMENGDLILVRQFRAGTQSDTLEFPGGAVNKNEETIKAAARELEEETGAVSNNIIFLGVMDPNPAFMTNKCYVYTALNCKFESSQHLDLFEDTEPLIVSETKFQEMVRNGEFTQSISLAAYGLYKNNL